MSEPTIAPATERDQPATGARLALIVLLVINLFNYLDRQVLSATLPSIGREYLGHLDEKDRVAPLGELAPAFMIAYMVFAPICGWLAEHVRRWWLVGAGVIAWSLASGASGLAGSFTALLITRCFVGIGEAAYGPAAPTLIADLYPVKRRGSVLAWFYMAIPVGSALGYVFGAVIAGSVLGWRWAFYLVVPPGLLLGIWCFFMPEPVRGQSDAGAGRRKATMKDYLVLLHTPSYVLNTLGMTAMTFALGGIAHFMPYYVSEFRKATTEEQAGAIFGPIVVVAGLTATLLGGIIGDRLRERIPGSYFLVSGIGMLLGFPLWLGVLYLPFPMAWVFVFLTCFCVFFNTGPTNTILANVTHPAVRATGYAVNIFIIHAFGDAISPYVIGQISVASGGDMNVGFLVVSAMLLASGLFWLLGTRYLQRDTALAPLRLGPETPDAVG